MIYKKINLAIFLSTITAFYAHGEIEVTGKVIHESGSYMGNGTTIGATSAHSNGDQFKSETSLRVMIDGTADKIKEGATYHVELQGYSNPDAIGDQDTNQQYTQRDGLREAYVDTDINDWLVRLGKQQVVWGTADGMKLLDAINPTDYSEMAQNQMEDSRIPVWMINAEKTDDKGGNWNFVVSEGKSNYMPGLGEESTRALGGEMLSGDANQFVPHTNHSQGSPFILKSVDTITGKKNGFLNIAPALGMVAQAFDRGALYNVGESNYKYVSLQGYTTASVNDFATGYTGGSGQAAGFKGFCDGIKTTAGCLANIVNNTMAPNGQNYGAGNGNSQNLMNETVSQDSWTSAKANPTYVIAYMPDATFATFDAFVNMKSKYLVDHSSRPTTALRYKNTTSGGSNYSFNFIRGNDANPYIDMEWQDTNGVILTETAVSTNQDYTAANGDTTYTTNQLRAAGESSNSVGGRTAGYFSTSDNAGTATDVAVLVMKEKLNPITQLGASFDTTFETDSLGPIVFRAEGLYQKDVMSPVITRKAYDNKDLNHGFLVSSLQMTKGDRFKYVLGADITALTNMMVSLQFIQDRNLDFVDIGDKDQAIWKYTGDMATMHLTNNLQKAEKNKDFYSLFLSKPFGASGQHRWNNIYMYEENGGSWNRFDVEYTINDSTIGTVEVNNYSGDENTQFGQLKESSNYQIGLKYLF